MSKFQFGIRPFVADDLPALHAIRLAAFAPVFQSFRNLAGPELAPVIYGNAEKEQGDWLDRICSPESGHHVAVAVSGAEVVGFCDRSYDTTAKIGTLGLNAVHPMFAGKGVGTELYRHAIAKMRDAEMKAVTVATGGDPSHAPARRAYAKAGLSVVIPSVQLSAMI